MTEARRDDAGVGKSFILHHQKTIALEYFLNLKDEIT
jgi:hypothetical protein